MGPIGFMKNIEVAAKQAPSREVIRVTPYIHPFNPLSGRLSHCRIE